MVIAASGILPSFYRRKGVCSRKTITFVRSNEQTRSMSNTGRTLLQVITDPEFKQDRPAHGHCRPIQSFSLIKTRLLVHSEPYGTEYRLGSGLSPAAPNGADWNPDVDPKMNHVQFWL